MRSSSFFGLPQMPFSSLVPRRRFLPRSDFGMDSSSRPHLMDLSSLEGPPIEDSRIVRSSHRNTRIDVEPPTPDNNTHPSRLWQSLPPRPSSTDPEASPSSLWPRPLQLSSNNRSPNHRSQSSLSEGQLRRAPAQRGRRTPSPDIDMDIDLHMELPIEPRAPALSQRPRSPVPDPVPLFNIDTDVQSPSRQSSRNQRARSCCQLDWRESEQRWVVLEPFPQPEEPLWDQSRTPGSPLDRMPVPEGYPGFYGRELDWVDLPPPYESHGFSPTA
ncbi:hypothetical protein PENSTE_c006G06029 [Penicillium steckii]|uniref:Uncharacterized protein n=1 Tax=Penicillium steckii TaxID=303698 RepID=A0A1V6TGP4_9EURO|nr:hypothetical protein PENSTE_c006G06029 [Penicillium steckii]